MNKFNIKFITVPELIDIDNSIDQIFKLLQRLFEYRVSFCHHHSHEDFDRKLLNQAPSYKYQLEIIYSEGKNSTLTILDIFDQIIDDPKYHQLNDFIVFLEKYIIFLKKQSEDTLSTVCPIVEDIGLNNWSVNEMIDLHRKMIGYYDNILAILNQLKLSNTYKLANGEITMTDIENQQKTQINFSGTFQQTQIQTGANSTMHISQTNTNALQQVCHQMREIIDQSNETPEAKQNLKDIVAEVEGTNNPATFKDAYTKLTSTLSNHLTILSAFGAQGILTELVKYLS